MSYRKAIVFQLGMVTMIGDVDTAADKEVSDLKQVCTGFGLPNNEQHVPKAISQKRVCSTCGEVPFNALKKAKLEGTTFKIVTDDEVAEVKNAALGATKKIIGITPHPVEGVEGKILPGGSVYAVSPSDAAQNQAYAMLRDTIQRHPEIVLLGIWTPASRASLFRFTTFGDTLVMEQQHRTESIKVAPTNVPELPEAFGAQVDLLLPLMMQPFDPATYEDKYASGLANLLASKEGVEGEIAERVKSEKTSTPVAGGDLMATLAAMAATLQAPAKAKKAKAS